MKHLTLAAAFASVISAGGCMVERDDHEGKTRVDIQSPVGDLSVRSDETPADTGLPVYPGARLQRKDDDHAESANVEIDTFLFDVKVAAASFESDDAPGAIVDFYRNAMTSYGSVTECRGEIDFRGRSRQPVCKEKPGSRELQLVVGTEGHQRVVSIEPRGDGSEFALVYVRTGR
jgi:hypothetical protein